MLLENYQQVEQEMDRLVQEAFFQADFLQTLVNGDYTEAQLRYFTIQYSYYSRHFPRVLGAAISAMAPIDTWWVPLAENLWDEAGKGIPGKAHEKLYLTFMLTVDPSIKTDEHGIPRDEPISPAVETAIQTFIDFFRMASPLEAMAAVGLGSELFAGDVMGQIGKGFKHPNYNRKREINVLFWDVHADEHEPHHYQLCKDILEQFTEPQDLRTMLDVGRRIAESEALMYQHLHEEMMKR
ncbi:hypothetical protein BEP19_04305 [Ammoniphilus oxalaticus]|uniref:Uncharacterized protein n=1 Tax=Ammoniphilus oxalaticus TaxID=66863 RepID=A0A419SMF7_9BACL|nr:hypothetical protein BEP19_04305 [Ammoniphilus oxalaticus]